MRSKRETTLPKLTFSCLASSFAAIKVSGSRSIVVLTIGSLVQ